MNRLVLLKSMCAVSNTLGLRIDNMNVKIITATLSISWSVPMMSAGCSFQLQIDNAYILRMLSGSRKSRVMMEGIVVVMVKE